MYTPFGITLKDLKWFHGINIWAQWYYITQKFASCVSPLLKYRCSWSTACRRCSNYIFILNLTRGLNGLGKGNYKTRRETFTLWDLVRLIAKVWRYCWTIWYFGGVYRIKTFNEDLGWISCGIRKYIYIYCLYGIIYFVWYRTCLLAKYLITIHHVVSSGKMVYKNIFLDWLQWIL